jgi:hypothetical protein
VIGLSPAAISSHGDRGSSLMHSPTVWSESMHFHPGVWQEQSPPVVRAHDRECFVVLMLQIIVLALMGLALIALALLIVLAWPISSGGSIVPIAVRQRIVANIG